MRKPVENSSAVLLIVSSIALAFLQALSRGDIENGVLIYIAQAFLLAASIFGLDVFVKQITEILNDKKRQKAEGHPE